MKQMNVLSKWHARMFPVTAWALLWALSACRPSYEVARVEGTRVAMDSTWDARPDAEAQALLAPYKQKVDSVMQQVLGKAALTMEPYRPESLLSNLVADILREAAAEVLGKPADMGLVNMGGLRSTLTAGDITMEDAYEILPFENALCVLTVKGSTLRQLFENIAYRLGEGVSGVSLQVSRDRKLLGAPLAENRWRMTNSTRWPQWTIWRRGTTEWTPCPKRRARSARRALHCVLFLSTM